MTRIIFERALWCRIQNSEKPGNTTSFIGLSIYQESQWAHHIIHSSEPPSRDTVNWAAVPMTNSRSSRSGMRAVRLSRTYIRNSSAGGRHGRWRVDSKLTDSKSFQRALEPMMFLAALSRPYYWTVMYLMPTIACLALRIETFTSKLHTKLSDLSLCALKAFTANNLISQVIYEKIIHDIWRQRPSSWSSGHLDSKYVPRTQQENRYGGFNYFTLQHLLTCTKNRVTISQTSGWMKGLRQLVTQKSQRQWQPPCLAKANSPLRWHEYSGELFLKPLMQRTNQTQTMSHAAASARC